MREDHLFGKVKLKFVPSQSQTATKARNILYLKPKELIQSLPYFDGLTRDT